MKTGLSPLALAGLSLLSLFPGPAQAQQPAKPSYVRKSDGWWRVEAARTYRVDPEIVSARFVPGIADLDALRAVVGALTGRDGELLAGLETLRSNRLGIHDLRVPPGADVLAVTAMLDATGLCEFAEANTIGEYVGASNDPSLNQQWHFINTGQAGGVPDADVDADIAWAITTGNPNVVVGVLDSGTQTTHPDLQFGTWINTDEIPGNGIDDDLNGYVDDWRGWDFANNNNNVEGPFFHGTAVTGLITAHTNNGLGVAGLAGGFGATQGCFSMACGVGDFGPQASILDDAILYAADNGCSVITMSLSVPSSSAINAALDEAWNNQNVFIDCAAGNSGGGPVSYPANNPNCVAVPATNRDDDRATFSSSGPENWVAAPGEDVYTTDLGGGYTFSSGTSFAAPHIAAGAALVFSLLPNTSNDSVKEILKLTADDVEQPGFDNGTGWGRLNAGSAVIEASDNDCNGNGVWDAEDISSGNSNDNDGDDVPDECQCPSPANYCQTAPNSNGPGALIGYTGSNSVAANDLVLEVLGASSVQPAIFYYGTAQQSLPFGNGWRCVGGTTFRLPITSTTGPGACVWFLDITNPPQPAGQIEAGDDWYFQFWFRDPAGGGAGFNLSNGLHVPFCP